MSAKNPGCWLIVLLAAVSSACGSGGSSSGGAESWSAAAPPEKSVPLENEDTAVIATAEFDPHWEATGAYASAASCGECHRAATDGSGVLRCPKP